MSNFSTSNNKTNSAATSQTGAVPLCTVKAASAKLFATVNLKRARLVVCSLLVAMLSVVSATKSFAVTYTSTISGGGTAAQNVCAGQNNVAIYSFTIAQATTANQLKGFTFTSTGTATSADISGFTVFVTNTAGLSPAAVYVGSGTFSGSGVGTVTNTITCPTPYMYLAAGTTYYVTIQANFTTVGTGSGHTITVGAQGNTLSMVNAITYGSNTATAGNAATITECPCLNYFAETGSLQTYSVPTGCTTLAITSVGASGGPSSGYISGTNVYESGGGLGGLVTASVTVTAGATLDVYVGGMGAKGIASAHAAGGYNGGGAGAYDGALFGGGGGGGMSDVLISPYTFGPANLLVCAGAGGGAGLDNIVFNGERGGAGGSAVVNGSGGPGYSDGTGTVTAYGSGGSQTAGGTGTTNGSLGQGGNSAATAATNGGGGGGYYGGGTGLTADFSGGGGGSSYVYGSASVTATYQQAVNAGNGYVIIAPLFTVSGGGTVCSPSTVTVTLNGSISGVNYQLYNGAAAVGSPVAGTGSAINFTGLSSSGTYSVSGLNGLAAATGMIGTATVTIVTPPNLTTWASPTAPSGCAGSGNTVTVNCPSLAAGTYNITYNISGGATGSGLVATLTMGAGGTGTFTTGSLTAASTTVTCVSVATVVGGCSTSVPGSPSVTFAVNTVPSLTPGGGVTYTNIASNPITFTLGSAYQTAIGSGYITAQLGAGPVYTLTPTTDYTVSSSGITLIPNSDHLITVSGSYTIVVYAPGYCPATVVQPIAGGDATQMVITTAPVGSATAPNLTTQPIITFEDVWGNASSTYSTSVVASAVGGTWTIGGTSTSSTTAGVANGFGFTATYVSSPYATVLFTSGSFTATATFSIPFPSGTAFTWYTRAASSSADLSQPSSWTSDPAGGAGAIPFAADFGYATRTWDVYYGSTPSLSGTWTVAGQVYVGNGTAPMTLIVPAAYALTGTGSVNINNLGTLDCNNATLPNLGTLTSNSTLILDGTANYTFPSTAGSPTNTYGNVTLNTSGTVTFTNNVNTVFNIGGNFRCTGSGTTGTNGVVGFQGGVATNPTYTFNVTGNMTVTNAAELYTGHTSTSSVTNPYVTFNVSGNDTVTGSGSVYFSYLSAPTLITINLNGGTTPANPQMLVSNSPYGNAYKLVVASGSTAFINSGQYNIPDYAGGAGYGSITVNGTLMIGASSIIFDPNATSHGVLNVSAGATLMIASPSGLLNSFPYGSIGLLATLNLNSGANYVFNGTAAQVTGANFTLSTANTITSGGSITCNNTAGTSADLTLSAALTINSGASVNLETGTMSTTNLIVASGSNVNVDNGHFNTALGTYSGINLGYKNLGNNNLSVTTSNVEWPATFSGNVTINKPGATITVNASKALPVLAGYGSVTLTSGTLNSGGNNISLSGNWSNNAGTGAFVPGAGTVSFTGSAVQTLGGTYPTTFNTLNINNSAGSTGVTLNVTGGTPTTTFASGNTLQLQNGVFTTTSAVAMSSGSNVVKDGGTISATPATYSGVNLTYADLGNNVAVTTGNEWPTSFTGNVNDNKAETVTLNTGSYAVTGNITLSSGILAAGANAMSLTGNWTTNNSGATPLTGTNTVTFNGSGQTIGGSYTSTFYNLTLGAAVSLAYNAAVTNTFALGNYNLTTGSYAITCPGNVPVSRGTGYVAGNLNKTLVTSPINYEVGDADYAPVSLALTGSPSGSIGVSVAHGNHPALGSSSIDGVNNVAHYWTIGAATGAAPSTVAPTFSYNTADIDGGSGSNAGYDAQIYNSGTWSSVISVGVTNSMTPPPSTSLPASSTYVGAYAMGQVPIGIPRTMFANYTPPTEDNLSTLPITFTDSGSWAEDFTLVTAQRTGSPVISTLSPAGDYVVNGPAGTLSLVPNYLGHTYLDTAGYYMITVYSSGYTGATVVQQVLPGAASQLVMGTQPAGPGTNGGTLATQPTVTIVDQYGNLTTSSAVITATVGAGAWTLGGISTNATASSGTASFSPDALTATSLGPVTGATIVFSSTGITSTTSNPFNIVAPNPPALSAAGGVTVDNPFVITFIDNATWRSDVTATGVTVNGTTLTAAAWTLASGTLTLNPASSALLQTPGTYTITVTATGYSATSCTQVIGIGAPNKLVVTTQPTSPAYNGGMLAVQPVVAVADQYGNIETALTGTSITASAYATPSWTIGGPSFTANTASGAATFSNLTASSAGLTTGAIITFSASGLTSVNSNPFNIPGPPANIYYNINSSGALADLSLTTSWTTDPVGAATGSIGSGSNPSGTTGNFPTSSSEYIIVNGTAPTLAHAWTVSGLGSYIVVGNSSTPITFSDANNAISGTINVNAGATLNIASSTIPTLGSLSSLSTVVYSGAGTQVITPVTYGNLTYSGSGTGTITNGIYNVAGNFLISNGNFWYIGNTTMTFNVGGTFTQTGGVFDIAHTSTGTVPVLNITGNASFSAGTFSCTNAAPAIYLYGNYSRTGTHIITGGAYLQEYLFSNTSSSVSSPQVITISSIGAQLYPYYIVALGCTAQMNSSWATTNINQTVQVNGAFIFPASSVISGAGTFAVEASAVIYTANTSGLNGSVTVSNRTWTSGSSYVFNGVSAQTTGSYLYSPIPSGSFVTINNPAGVTLSSAVTFSSGSNLNLEAGNMATTNLTLNAGANVNADNGSFASSPTYPTGINVTYKNLGVNNLAVTAGNEWPASMNGNLTVNKTGATITLNGAKTLTGAADGLTLTAGTLDVNSTGNYGITTAGSWTNNAGSSAFNAEAGTVTFNGGSGVIGGSYGTKFNILSINANTTLSAATTFGSDKTLNLENGTFSNGSNLSMSSGSNVNVDNGTLSTAPSTYSGVKLTYTSLGANTSITTGAEWPASFTGNVIVNKTGQTITLGGNKSVTGPVTITAGTLDASASNYGISLTGTWTNNGIFNARSGTVTFNGTAAQTNAGTSAAFYNLTLNNTAGLTLGLNTTVSNLLTLTNGIISTGLNTLSMTTAPGTVSRSASSTSNYVNGTLVKAVTGYGATTPINFEVGDADYAPVSISTSANLTGAGATFAVTDTAGHHPQYASAGIDGTFYVDHYWTISAPVAPTGSFSITPTFSYNTPSDVGGGSNTSPAPWVAQMWNGTSWTAVNTSATDPTGNSTSVPTTSASYLGQYIVGLNDQNTPPAFTPAAGVNEDNASVTPATFTLSPATGVPSIADWKAHITLVTAKRAGGSLVNLTGGGTDYGVAVVGTSGTFSLVPTSADDYLTTAGTYTINISSVGYTTATLVQTIAAGAPAAMTITDQPTNVTTNGSVIPGITPPYITINMTDRFGNAASGSATITGNAVAGVGGAVWTAGSNTITGSSPITFSTITASSLGAVTGATIQFTGTSGSSTLTPTTSNTFNINAPAPPALTAAAGATVDNPFSITYTDNSVWRAAITSVLVNGSTLAPAAWSTSAGNLTLTPSASALLQTAGSYTITVLATGYTNDVLSTQPIGAGVGAKLVMGTQPAAPAFNGGPLLTQPTVIIQDHYGNATSSTAPVSAGASGGSSSWTLGGTTTVNGAAGTVTYSGLTASSALSDPGATITFSITSTYGIATVTSNSFNIPNPPITYYDKAGTGNDLSVLGNWTTSASGAGGSAPTTFASNSQKFVIRNGTNPTLTAGSLAISGTGSYLNVGNDTASVNFIIPSGQTYTGLINVGGNSTLTTANTTMPTWGSFDPTSTVVFNGTSQVIPVSPSYGNLTFKGTTGTIAAGTLTVGSTFSVTGTSTLIAPGGGIINVAGLTSVSGGTLANGGTGTINLRGDLSVTGTGAITGTTLNTINFINASTTQNITWTGGANTNTALNINASCTAVLSSGLPLSSGSGVLVNGTLTCGTNAISGSGAFTVNSGGTINTASTTGLTGSITTSGTKTFTSGANYIFSASSAITTPWLSALGTANNVSISNAVLLTSNAAFSLNGTLAVPTGATLDMSTFALGGTPTIANSGTIQTENTTSAPFPTNLTWGGTVNYNGSGSAQTVMKGTYNNLTLGNSGGYTISASPLNVNGVLALNAGKLDIAANTLTLGTAATVTTSGSFSSTDQIVTSSTSGVVQKVYGSSGSFTYPIGDASNYSPITLSVTGAGTVGVYVQGVKDPNDHATTDYLNRYWHVSASGVTNYSITSANYVSPGDVVGTESNIHAAQWTGSAPWIMGAAESGSTLSFGTITRPTTELSGLSAPVPTFTVTPAAAICAGLVNTVSYGTQSGETSYVWNVPGTAGTDYVITAGGTGSSNNFVTLYWITPGSQTVTVNYTDGDGLTGVSPATNTTFVSSLTLSASNNSPACVGSTVNLSSGESGSATPVTYAWNGPAGYSNSTSGPTLSISGTDMGGTYTIVATGGSCSVTSTTIVTVNTISIAANNSSPACVGGTINLTSTPSGTSTPTGYAWSGPLSFGAGTQNTTLTTSATTDMSGVYVVTVTAAGSGCSATGTTTVTVNTIGIAADNDGPACVGGTVHLTSTPSGSATPTGYAWSGPGYTAGTQNPTLTTSATTAMTGIYVVTVTATGSACSAVGTTTVTINTIGIAANNDGPACVGGTVNLTSTPSGSATPTGYAWSGPLSFTASVENPTLTTSATTDMSGIYVVTVTATGSACSAIGTATVTINTIATAPTNDGPACVGGTVNLFAGASGTETITSYSWSGPGFTSGSMNPSLSSVTTDMTGIYTVTVSGSGSNCSATNTTNVTVNTIYAAPNNDGPACVGGTVNLTSNVTGSATPGTYQWSGPAGYNSTLANPTLSSVTTAMAGTYNFTVIATGSNCIATGTTTVTVNTLGIVADNDGPACVGGTINLTSTPSGSISPASYTWSGPIGFSASTENTNLTTSATTDMTGLYTVTVTAPGSGCSAWAATSVSVNILNTAPSNDGPACVGSTVNLYSNISTTTVPTSYSWSGPAFSAATSNTSLTSVTTDMTGTYNFTVTATGSGCIATGSTNVVVNNLGVAAGNDAPACVGGTVNFTATPSGSEVPTNYNWSGPHSFSSTMQNPSISGATLLTAGTYTVIMSGMGTGCSTSATTTVTINTLGITAHNDGPACVGGTVNLTSNASGTAVPTGYAWGGPLGFSAGTQNTNLTTSATTDMSGIYAVTVTATGSGCTAVGTTSVTVNSLGISATNDGPACLNAVVILTSTPSGTAAPTSYSWIGPDGFTNTNQITSVAPVAFANAGVYTVTVTANGSACTATATTNVVIRSLSINAFNDGPTCAGLITNLTSVPGGTSVPTGYTWSGPLGFTATTQNTMLSPASVPESGTYTVVVTAVGTGCLAYATTNVTILPTPVPISGIAQMCVGATSTLSDATAGGMWSSTNTGIATIGTAGAPTSPHLVSGLYAGTATISYTTSSDGCASTVVITVNPNPVISGMAPVCTGSTLALSDNISGGVWSAANAYASVGSSSGIITGMNNGTDAITYTLPTSCRAISVATINPTPTAIGGTHYVCQGQTTTVNEVTGGGHWVSGNTSVATLSGSTGTSVTVTGIIGGTSVISYIMPTGCYATAVVTVNSLSPITGNAPVCQGATVTLSDLALGGTWSSGSTGVATVGSVSGVVTGVAGGTAHISYTTFSGCLSVVTATVNPVAGITGTASVCEGATTTLSDATAGGTWSSSSPANGSVSAGSGLVSGILAGTTTISYQVTSTGCIATKVVTVNAGAGTIMGTGVMCAGMGTTLSDAVMGGTWISSNPAVGTIGSATGAVTGIAGGTANITYKITAGGCQATTIVTVNTTPGAITGNAPLCQSATISLHEATTGGTWISSTPSVATVGSTGSIVTLTGTGGGTSTISYVMPAGCMNSVVVTVNPITPVTGAAPVCIGATVALTDATAGGNWSSSNTARGTVDGSGNVTGIGAGTVNITYLMPTGCKSVAVETVNALPAAITGTMVMCSGGSAVTLHDATAGGSWSGVAGTGTILVVGSTGSVTGTSAGTATVSYATAAGCGVAATVTVNPTPAGITGNTPVCAGSTLSLGETVSGGTWSSSTPATGTVNASGVVTAIAGGTSTISYSTGSGCSTSVIVTVNTILPITGSPALCLASTTNLADATLGGTWSSSDMSTASVGSTGIVTGNLTGTATIYYTTATCVRSLVVTVNPLPSGIMGTLTVCRGATTTLSDDGSGTWSSSNTAVATVVSSTGVVSGVSAGTTTIKYTVGSGCFASVVVTVSASPSGILGSAFVCVGSSTVLSDLVGGGSWSTVSSYASVDAVSGSVTGISAGSPAVITYTAAGTGCYMTYNVSVDAAPAPITGIPVVCVGGTTFLYDATTPAVSWTSSNTTIATITASGAARGVSTGTVLITYQIDNTCTATTTLSVNAVPPPFTGNTPFCVGSGITLSDALAGGSWSTTNPSIATIGTDGSVTGVSGGNTLISYTVYGGGCSAAASVTVTAVTAITGPSIVCTGSSITLANTSPGGTWSSASSTVSVNAATGSVSGSMAGTAVITYTFAGGGCAAMKTLSVNATPTPINGNGLLCIGTQLALSDDVTGGTWASSNTPVATAGGSTGIITGMAAGTATITYTVAGCSASAVVTVNAAQPVTGAMNVCVGAITNLMDARVGGTWSSSSPAIGSVSTTGTVRGLSAGTTTISYSLSSGCVNTAVVTVNPVPDAITGNGPVCVGGMLNLSDDIGGGAWHSSDGVVTIDGSGDVSAIAIGTAAITYTSPNGCTTNTVVTVGSTPAAITGPLTVCEGGTVILNDATLGGVWTSTTGNATIGSSTGVVGGVTAGTATISYTLTGCGSVTADVTVNPSPAAITGNTPVCIGSMISLGETTSGGAWAASGSASVDGSGNVTGVSAGTAAVSYTAGGCSTIAIVTVAAMPAGISAPAYICLGATVMITDGTPGGAWSSSDATITIGTSTGVVTGEMVGTASITYTTAAGCTTTTVLSVNVATSPIFGALTVCNGTSTLYTDATFGGAWSTSNAAVATVGTDGSVGGVNAGTATISYNTGGCISTQVITVNPAPASITGPAAVCPGATVSLADASGGGVWSATSTYISLDGSGNVTGVNTGVATVTYTLGTHCFVTRGITISPAPAAIQGNTTVCQGSTTLLSDATTPAVSWSSSNTTVATINAAGAAMGVSPGSVTIIYTATNTCTTATTLTVLAATAPITGNAPVCIPGSVTLSDAAGSGTWISGNTAIATIGSATGTVVSVATGTAAVTYSLPGAGCSVTTTVTVNAAPDAGTISGSGTVCAGSSVTFSDGAAGGVWSSTNTAAGTINTYGTVSALGVGTTTISYTVTNSCGTVAATAILTVNPLPNAGMITGNTGAICAGSVLALTDAVTGGTWSSSNTATGSVDASGNVTGVAGGIATITYTVTNSCGIAITTTPVTVNAFTAGTITGGSAVIIGLTDQLSDAVTGGTWTASNSNATVSGTGLVTGSAAGTVTISYTVANGCGTVTATYVVTVSASGISGITGSLSVCQGQTTALTDATGGGTWHSSNTLVATVGTSGIVTATATGSVSATATISYTVGGVPTMVVVTVNPNPSGIVGAASICSGNTMTLSDLVAGGAWTASSDVTLTPGSAATVTGFMSTTVGTSTVTYSLATGCAKSLNATVKALPTPILGNLSVCGVGKTTILSDMTTTTSWASSAVGTATVNAAGVVYGVSPGTATIIFTAPNTCTTTATVTVYAAVAVATISGTSSVGHGLTITLSDLTGGGTWSSSNAALGSVDASGDVTGVGTSGTVTISYNVPYGSGCIATATKPITVHTPAPPSHVVGGTITVFAGSAVNIADETLSGIWSSSNTSVATVDNAGSVTGVTPGTANITHVVVNGYGESTTTVTPVIVSELPVDVRVVPNPNNGTFTIKGTLGTLQDEEVSLEVTDVLGQVIYSHKVTAQGGRINEAISLSGTLANGMYMLNLHSGSADKTFHFAVEK